MKQSMRLFAALFLVLLLALATENGPRAVEARTCGSPSQKFKGVCVSNRNCANVCATERFPSGDCAGLRRRCICRRPCA